MSQNAWLLKSEPHVYSFEDLWAEPDRRTLWDGIRNYQARNRMRDEMQVGDGVLFYHSSCPEPGVAGVAVVDSGAVPDPTQFDPDSTYFDPKSTREDPPWLCVRIRAVQPVARFVPLTALREDPALAELELLRRGNRLSVQAVAPAAWARILELAGLERPGLREGPRRKP